MDHIGRKIKELRKQNGMTQEDLAERLHVSFQAVSKWETGNAAPDLSQIVPLADLFGVTTDALLRFADEECAQRKTLRASYEAARQSGDLQQTYLIAKDAVLEYPEEAEYLAWLAAAEYSLAFEEAQKPRGDVSAAYLEELTDNSLRRYESLIEHCTDPQLLGQAVLGKIIGLRFLERIAEADWSAEFEYPD